MGHGAQTRFSDGLHGANDQGNAYHGCVVGHVWRAHGSTSDVLTVGTQRQCTHRWYSAVGGQCQDNLHVPCQDRTAPGYAAGMCGPHTGMAGVARVRVLGALWAARRVFFF